MLLKNLSTSIQKIQVHLILEDDVVRFFDFGAKDIIWVKWNKNGLESEIEGSVVSIHTSSDKGLYFIVDGSGTYAGKVETIFVSNLLDATLLQHYDENLLVKTVSGGTNGITHIRVNDEGYMQISTNNGKTWVTPKTYNSDDKIDLATDVTGVLPIINGGTGASTSDAARASLNAAKDETSTSPTTETPEDSSTTTTEENTDDNGGSSITYINN